MSSNAPAGDEEIYALINYNDPYVQPLILSALEKRLLPSSYILIDSLSGLPSPTNKLLQWRQYEEIDFEHLLSHTDTSLTNAYIIRKALIRKHYLSTTISNWIAKHPKSVLKKHVKESVEFEVDYAEFLDDALVEAWELKESWERGKGKGVKEREWWILKPGMSERGQGIRLFSSEEELVAIFEEWDPESDDEEEDEEEEEEQADARIDTEASPSKTNSKAGRADAEEKEHEERSGIITSQLRHFIAQPYIHPPLLLSPPSSSTTQSQDPALRKFHIRTYVLAVGALQVYVYRDMLALFAAKSYSPPWESSNGDQGESLKAHLTNTCLQDSNEREGSVELFWNLPDTLFNGTEGSESSPSTSWKKEVFDQICKITGEVFEAAARSMSIHFQALPNSFEIFGLDFMIGVEKEGELRTYLLEVNAFPDFRQTGEELKGIVEGLFESVVDVAVGPFFGADSSGGEKIVKVLDIDLGRR